MMMPSSKLTADLTKHSFAFGFGVDSGSFYFFFFVFSCFGVLHFCYV
jgi:hypothetical protein